MGQVFRCWVGMGMNFCFHSGFLMYAAVKSLGCDDFECLWDVTQSSTLVTCSFQPDIVLVAKQIYL